MPNLKTLILEYTSNFELIIDFVSLKNLKYFTGEPKLFLLLNKSPLEKIDLLDEYSSKKNFGERLTKAFISMNTLKEISFHIENEWLFDMFKSYGDNYSIIKMKIFWHFDRSNYSLIDFQNYFKNLSDLTIEKKRNWIVL